MEASKVLTEILFIWHAIGEAVSEAAAQTAFSTILASFTLFSVVPSSSIMIVKLLCSVYVRPHRLVMAGIY